MSAGFQVVRRARKALRCGRCFGMIPAGDRYRSMSLPPDDPDVGNVGWWHLNECAACAALCRRPLPPPRADGAPEAPAVDDA